MLDPGDVISQSISMSIKTALGEAWVRAEGSTTLREGETSAKANRRLREFVECSIAANAESFLKMAEEA